ncbi:MULTISPECIES: plasmid pRiA4b ORF-3 family protein [unclassified Burkholderia]|uniref:plasmid pRiA4b ORF-3 family protein n=1 Tax=unclassified Burkholderia TaxID=2613784 RepID=UPI00214F97F1|nr:MULTISPECIES: plasmid pRiA4b ORF-3 family protein [unclassified Burkholderia]MCR4471622.1 plasmid pRiA4b ORF-3 family protein [Burkholderia sp. SCN-KJ]
MPKSFPRFTLKVALQHIDPPIWRQIEVEGTESLRKLHHILQAAFGWEDTHLHDFLIDGMTYAMFEIDDVVDFADTGTTADDRKVRLQAVLKPGSRFVYRYDFGDGWNHSVVVEKMETIEGQPWGEAQVIGGARACPPEDVGGPSGYEAFLNTLSNDPDSEKAERYRNWIGSGFDAELFDLRAANAALLRMASNRWGNR